MNPLSQMLPDVTVMTLCDYEAQINESLNKWEITCMLYLNTCSCNQRMAGKKNSNTVGSFPKPTKSLEE